MHASPLETDDLMPLLDGIGRFADNRIAPLASRPERPPDPASIAALSREAHDLGLLPSGSGDPGFGLWEQPGDPTGIAFSLGALRRVAAVNAGIAMAWHRSALARYLVRLTMPGTGGMPEDPLALTVTTTGHHGLGRGALARWLSRQDSAEDQCLLADWLDRERRQTAAIATPQWRTLIWPAWYNGGIHWQLLHRKQLWASRCHRQHGLDELAVWQLSSEIGAASFTPAEPEQMASLLILDALGMLSIAAGIHDHGEVLAREFAGLRRQGGQTINRHPAVQTMLGTISQIQWEAETTLQGLTRRLSDLSVKHLMMARQQLHPRLCLAADLIMQVHGGVGYMQDCGPEKLLRDQNMLRLQSGGIREIPLFIQACPEL